MLVIIQVGVIPNFYWLSWGLISEKSNKNILRKVPKCWFWSQKSSICPILGIIRISSKTLIKTSLTLILQVLSHFRRMSRRVYGFLVFRKGDNDLNSVIIFLTSPNTTDTSYIFMYVYIYACMYVCMYLRIYVSMYVSMYVCIYVCKVFFFTCLNKNLFNVCIC